MVIQVILKQVLTGYWAEGLRNPHWMTTLILTGCYGTFGTQKHLPNAESHFSDWKVFLLIKFFKWLKYLCSAFFFITNAQTVKLGIAFSSAVFSEPISLSVLTDFFIFWPIRKPHTCSLFLIYSCSKILKCICPINLGQTSCIKL